MADSATNARKERRRRKAAEDKSVDKMAENQTTFENGQPAPESSTPDRLFRRDTYILSKSKSDINVVSLINDSTEKLNMSSIGEGSASEGSVRTYNITRKSSQRTFNVVKSEPDNFKELRPVPAPRATKSSPTQITPEKVSSDTDRDVADLDLDDLSAKNKSDTDSKSVRVIKPPRETLTSASDESVVVPVPKPRTRVQLPEIDQRPVPQVPLLEIGESSDETQHRTHDKEDKPDDPSPFPVKSASSELPLLEPLEYALKSDTEIREIVNKSNKLRIGDLISEKKAPGKKPKKTKSAKIFSSIVKLEKGKIPKISSILKELKDSEKKGGGDGTGEGPRSATRPVPEDQQEEEEEDNSDFQVDSPRYPESVQNGQIYVQDKTGFYVMEREDVLKGVNAGDKNSATDRRMAGSTVKTAIFFQKYWSRTMMYFHGILAGFAFGHAAMVTAIVVHFNYDPRGFIDIYSRLSLKIHYIFYALTAFCIVSCFDRVDIGHINRKHWRTAWRVPSMWAVLFIYIVSFGLTFANQKTQARFDAYSYIQGNDTDEKIWNTKVPGQIQVGFLAWFHTVWARDALLLVAWFIISLTKFSDFLCSHLTNMIRYSDIDDVVDGKL